MAPRETTVKQYVDYIAGGNISERTAWPDGALTVNIAGLADAPAMRASAALALEAWTATTGLTFRILSGGADIVIGNDGFGQAFSITDFDGGNRIVSAEITVSTDWMDGFPADERWEEGTYGLQTFIHEIGHALGLDHGGPYDGFATYEDDALFDIDTYQFSVMSYFEQRYYGDATDLFVVTPMIADIAAIGELYGVRPVNAGATVYGGGGLYDFGAFPDAASTISDTGGEDTLDLRSADGGARINLAPGTFSDINGHLKNLTIAEGTLIERVFGTAGADAVTGNVATNLLRGFGGADRLNGGGGADVIEGGLGADRLTGGLSGDDFRYLSAAEMVGDLIFDFVRGLDDVVFAAIDADVTRAGNQAFSWIGKAAFGREAGELRYAFANADTYVTGDLNGDGRTDLTLRLDGQIALGSNDFLL